MDNVQKDVAYLRLSLADGDGKDESTSISSQRKRIWDFWKKQGQGTKLEEYIDDGFSGTNFERPGFQRLLSEVREGKIRTLLVKDLSRFGRNYLEAGYYLEYVFPYYGVRVIAVNDNFDSLKASGSTGGLEMALRNLMNECYSRDISKKVTSSTRIKKKNGEYCYGAVAFGYKKGKQHNTIVPDEEAAKIVKHIFELACEGNTITQICRILNKEKVITPSIYMQRTNYRSNECWTYNSIQNILKNRIYTGDTECFKSHVKRVGCNAVNVIPEKEREVVLNTHQAIVSREEYWKARNVIKPVGERTRGKESGSVLTGILVCGSCGTNLLKGKKKNKDFLCANRRYIPGSDCEQIRVREQTVLDVIKNAVNVQLLFLEKQEEEMKQLRKKRKKESLIIQKQIEKLEKQRKNLVDRGVFLYENYIEGKSTKEQYLAEKEDNQELKEKYEEQLQDLKKQLEEQEIKEEQDKEKQRKDSMILQFHNQEEITKEMLQALVEKITVYPDGEIEILWKFRDELNQDMNNKNEPI